MASSSSSFRRSSFVLALGMAAIFLRTTAMPVKDFLLSQATRPPHQERHKREATRTACAIPSNVQEMLNEINRNMSRTTFLRGAVNGEAVSTATGGFSFLQNRNEDTSCPSSVPHDASIPLKRRTLCPYFFNVIRLPEGYYPPTLRWAQCKCQQCVEASSFGIGCEAVMSPTVVLRPAGCYQGMQKYEEKIIPISTSCVCAFRAFMSDRSSDVAFNTWGSE